MTFSSTCAMCGRILRGRSVAMLEILLREHLETKCAAKKPAPPPENGDLFK